MTAVLFGSIGALADTSELQREAFNEAFRAHGLDWNWSQDEYQRLLAESGGEQRIAAYAEPDRRSGRRRRGAPDEVRDLPAEPADAPDRAACRASSTTIEQASRNGVQVALVTTTSGDNVAALAQALRPADRRRQLRAGRRLEQRRAPEAGARRLPLRAGEPRRGRRATASRSRTTSAAPRRQSQPACRASPSRARTTPATTSRSRLTGSTSSTSATCRPSSPTASCTGPVQPDQGKRDERDPGDLSGDRHGVPRRGIREDRVRSALRQRRLCPREPRDRRAFPRITVAA